MTCCNVCLFTRNIQSFSHLNEKVFSTSKEKINVYEGLILYGNQEFIGNNVIFILLGGQGINN